MPILLESRIEPEPCTAVVTAADTDVAFALPVPRVTEPLREPSRAACCSATQSP